MTSDQELAPTKLASRRSILKNYFLVFIPILFVFLTLALILYPTIREFARFVHRDGIYSNLMQLDRWVRTQTEAGKPFPSDLDEQGGVLPQLEFSWRSRFAAEGGPPFSPPAQAKVFRILILDEPQHEIMEPEPYKLSRAAYIYLDGIPVKWSEPADVVFRNGRAQVVSRSGTFPVDLRDNRVLRLNGSAEMIPADISPDQVLSYLYGQSQ